MTIRTVDIEALGARLVRALVGPPAKPRRANTNANANASAHAHAHVKRSARASTRKKKSLVETSRAAISVLANDCTAFAEAAARQTQRSYTSVAQQTLSLRKVWLPSFVALGSADVAIASVTAARSSLGLEAVGAIGGLGLMGVATVNLWRARTSEEALDASADLAWGVQGFSYVTGAARVAPLTTGMGFVGAAARMSVGVVRIRRGMRTGDTQAMKLGALDLGAGILWGALDVAGWSHPVVLGSYVAMMVGREAYANKDTLREVLATDVRRLLEPACREVGFVFPRASAWATP
jgi:hypothetical protein